MDHFLFYALAFVVALSVLVIVHEFGHFWVARINGVKVLRFSLGFGPVLYSRRLGRDGTEWALSAIPLGGYVNMLGESDDEVPPGEWHRAFRSQNVWRRMAIVIAGPAANFLLAILLFWGLFFHGTEELRPLLGTPVKETPAAQAGFREGELALKVNGEPVQTWQEMRWHLLRAASEQDSADIEVIGPEKETAIRRLDFSPLKKEGLEADFLGKLGLVFFRPKIPPVIDRVSPGSAAERAQILPGDEILSIDGEAIADSSEMIARINASPGVPMRFIVLRGGARHAFSMTPDRVDENGKSMGRIGVFIRAPDWKKKEIMTVVRYAFFPALGKALEETYDKSLFTLKMIGKMLTGVVSWRTIGGPLTIADYAGQSARLGLDYYLNFLGMISISLGVFNLLPLPILDGGHLMYYVAEWIRRKPFSEQTLELGQRIGVALLVLLMVCSFYNDINRLIYG